MLLCHETHFLEVAIGRDDGAQALFGALVAAIGIGMVNLDQGLVGPLDLVGFLRADQAQRLQGAPILLMQRLDALGRRRLRLAMTVFGEDAEGVAIFVTRTGSRGAGCTSRIGARSKRWG